VIGLHSKLELFALSAETHVRGWGTGRVAHVVRPRHGCIFLNLRKQSNKSKPCGTSALSIHSTTGRPCSPADRMATPSKPGKTMSSRLLTMKVAIAPTGKDPRMRQLTGCSSCKELDLPRHPRRAPRQSRRRKSNDCQVAPTISRRHPPLAQTHKLRRMRSRQTSGSGGG